MTRGFRHTSSIYFNKHHVSKCPNCLFKCLMAKTLFPLSLLPKHTQKIMCNLFVVYTREKTRKFLTKGVIIMHLWSLSNTISFLISLLAAFSFHDVAEFSFAFGLEENVRGSTGSFPTWECLFQVCPLLYPARPLHPSRPLQKLNAPFKYYYISNQQGWLQEDGFLFQCSHSGMQ